MYNFYISVLFLFAAAFFTHAQDYSLNFDGNSYVSIAHSDTLNLGNQFTIECWFTVQGPSLNDWVGMICKMENSAVPYSGYFFGLGQSSSLPNWIHFRIYPSTQNMMYEFSPNLNQWYNLAVTYNDSIMMMFLDGELVQQTAGTDLIAGNTFPLTIGGQNGNWWNRNLNGQIDEVRISSIARYDTSFTTTTYFDNDIYTIALYHFNEGIGDTLLDSSGNHLNGVIYGATWSNGVLVSAFEELMNPAEFIISQNYPNPFNSTTKIKYSVPQISQVQIKLFDVLGKEIETLASEVKPAGIYDLIWNATNLSTGIYFYQLRATPIGGQAGDPSTSSRQDFIQTKKMILLK